MSGAIGKRVDKLRQKILGDPVLRDQVSDFLDHGTWDDDGDGTVTGKVEQNGVGRIIELDAETIRLGRSGFPERKRIPWK